MSFLSGAQRAPGHSGLRRHTHIVLLAFVVAAGVVVVQPAPPTAAAVSGPKVAVIVGPSGSATARYRDVANKAASEALRYTSNVVKVYSPNATWSRVKAALTGASVVVYVGRGYGFPSPRSTIFRPGTQDGLGLNPVAGVNNTSVRYYGERYIRRVALARSAVVLLSHARYAPGNGEAGSVEPTLGKARRRVDNYGAGFLAAGASAVISEMSASPVYYVRTIFTRTLTLDEMWRAAPSRHGHVTSFRSTRTSGSIGRTDPVRRRSGYSRAIVGRLVTSTASVRGTLPATQAPTPKPAPKPTPKPAPKPTPSPAGIAVPSTIDATGATDVSAALISLVGSVPDGSTIVFKAGGVYRLNAALKFAHRHNLTFEGKGATLKAGGGTTEASSLFWLGSYLGGNTGIVIRNFTLVGNSPTPGVYQGGREGAHGILVDDGSTIDVSNVTVRGVWGDCLYVGGWADAVSFHDSTCESNGRNGVTITSGTNVTVQRVAFNKSGYTTFDIEPNVSSEGARTIRFLDNTAGTWTNSFVSAEGAAGSVVDGVTISRNTVTGASILTAIQLSTRRKNIVFTSNTGRVAAWGPVLRFAYIDGLTVTGNVQPLTSGSLASISNSTGVTYQP